MSPEVVWDTSGELYIASYKTGLGWDELNPNDPWNTRNMCGFCGRMLWLVNGKLWGMTAVRFCGYGVAFVGGFSGHGSFSFTEWLLQEAEELFYRPFECDKESCIGNGCLKR
ncbi:hypothetical protein TIFTF001_020526 [Ficus carica]|uniref:Uncharacterized protein n=1 Tax=Ficus carica TaxID=3494 RepID=A0AA88DDR1_FICCA|nr:hypothetical protein TIFTF001_020526 [Ficus carica]